MALQRGIGKLVLTIRDKFVLRLLGAMQVSRKLYEELIQSVGTLTIFFGMVISAMGLYGFVSGGGITFAVSGGVISLPTFLASVLTSLAGILLLVEGIALIYVSFKPPRLIILSVVFGFFALNIPAILIGMGYSLAAGIAAIVFGYCWLVTVFVWLLRGE
jgi:hypothetical protein